VRLPIPFLAKQSAFVSLYSGQILDAGACLPGQSFTIAGPAMVSTNKKHRRYSMPVKDDNDCGKGNRSNEKANNNRTKFWTQRGRSNFLNKRQD
jgi:hypothetical protein